MTAEIDVLSGGGDGLVSFSPYGTLLAVGLLVRGSEICQHVHLGGRVHLDGRRDGSRRLLYAATEGQVVRGTTDSAA